MNNFYHKIAVASVGIALGFTLGVPKEAKAVTFSLITETRSYHLENSNQDGLQDSGDTGASLAVGIRNPRDTEEYRAFYEFNIPNLSLDSNTTILSATLLTFITNIRWYRPHSQLAVYGYTENEKVDTLKVYNPEEYLDQIPIGSMSDTLSEIDFIPFSASLPITVSEFVLTPTPTPAPEFPPLDPKFKTLIMFDVVPFFDRIGSNNSFAGFGIRFSNDEGFINLTPYAYLNITTAVLEPVPEPSPFLANERVPEPTTIFGSAIGICLGGWLKRKKSTPPNKTTSQG